MAEADLEARRVCRRVGELAAPGAVEVQFADRRVVDVLVDLEFLSLRRAGAHAFLAEGRGLCRLGLDRAVGASGQGHHGGAVAADGVGAGGGGGPEGAGFGGGPLGGGGQPAAPVGVVVDGGGVEAAGGFPGDRVGGQAEAPVGAEGDHHDVDPAGVGLDGPEGVGAAGPQDVVAGPVGGGPGHGHERAVSRLDLAAAGAGEGDDLGVGRRPGVGAHDGAFPQDRGRRFAGPGYRGGERRGGDGGQD